MAMDEATRAEVMKRPRCQLRVTHRELMVVMQTLTSAAVADCGTSSSLGVGAHDVY